MCKYVLLKHLLVMVRGGRKDKFVTSIELNCVRWNRAMCRQATKSAQKVHFDRAKLTDRRNVVENCSNCTEAE